MKKHNIYSFLVSLDLCIFFAILLCKRSSAADPQYEACAPRSCGRGPNISFPFYISNLQKSYCGYPGFVLTCSQDDGFPVLHWPENNGYLIEDIFYHNRSLHVYNSAVIRSDNTSSCLPGIRNTTLPSQFYFISTKGLRLFTNCNKSMPREVLGYNVSCGSFNDGGIWELALYGDDENLRNAMENCDENVVAPVEEYGDEGDNNGRMNVIEVLRKGFLLKWTASGCNDCEESGGRCGFNPSNYHFRCFCPDRPHSRSCTPGKSSFRKIFLIGGVTMAALTSISVVLFIVFRRKRTLLKLLKLQKENLLNEKDIELFLKNNGNNFARRRFKYSEIKKMTKSFSENLGKGGYGSVYKGKLHDGRLVAVKILHESKGNGKEFMNEIASISRTSHVNVVTLLGFCFDGSKKALIYDFMPNGSLENFIPSTASSSIEDGMGWKKLSEIAIGIARGLEYLHQGCNTRVLHFDIKPHNILLDKDLNPKISDFGLAKLCPNRSSKVSMLVARGTIGYIAPEVFCRNFGEVSHKSDVYSYGMMVLEIAGGRKNIDRGQIADRTSEIYFPQYIYKQLEMDGESGGSLDGNMNEDETHFVKRKLMIVGLWCVQTDPKDRPSMKRVVEMLEGKLEVLKVPPKSHHFSPPRSLPSFSNSESLD